MRKEHICLDASADIRSHAVAEMKNMLDGVVIKSMSSVFIVELLLYRWFNLVHQFFRPNKGIARKNHKSVARLEIGSSRVLHVDDY